MSTVEIFGDLVSGNGIYLCRDLSREVLELLLMENSLESAIEA